MGARGGEWEAIAPGEIRTGLVPLKWDAGSETVKKSRSYTPARFVRSPSSQMSRKPIDKPSALWAL